MRRIGFALAFLALAVGLFLAIWGPPSLELWGYRAILGGTITFVFSAYSQVLL
jgi:hypothetical protein